MAAIAHSPSFAKKVGVPMSVGKDFADGDDFSFFNEHTFDEQINKVFKNGTIDIAEDVVSIQQALDDELITIEDGISLLQALEQL